MTKLREVKAFHFTALKCRKNGGCFGNDSRTDDRNRFRTTANENWTSFARCETVSKTPPFSSGTNVCMKDRFEDQVCVVTGSASGIGREMTRKLMAARARVAMLDIDSDGMNALVQEFPERELAAIDCNICQIDACENSIAQVVKKWGRVDMLINNAGIAHRSEFRSTELSVIRSVMEVNFFGAVNCTHAALPHLLASNGRIGVLSSVAGFAPLLGRTGYCASKHALHGFFNTLRAELRDEGVSVTIACPSFVKTAIDANALGGDGPSDNADKRVVGKLLEPEHVATIILDAMGKRREQVNISPIAKASYWLSRLLPPLYERAMRRSTAESFD